MLLTCVGTEKAFEQTRSIIGEILATSLNISAFNPSVPAELVNYHLTGSVLNLMKWWLERGGDYGIDEIERYASDLIFKGVLHVLGLGSKAELEEAFRQQVQKARAEAN